MKWSAPSGLAKVVWANSPAVSRLARPLRVSLAEPLAPEPSARLDAVRSRGGPFDVARTTTTLNQTP